MCKQPSICLICGKKIDFWLCPKRTLAKAMKSKTLCFECAYWTDYIEHPSPGTVIISGGVYEFTPIFTKIDWRQLKKKDMVYAIEIKTGKAVSGYKPFFIGSVPDNFKEKLPDQFKFISKETYLRIVNHQGGPCMAKGCWDRYHCYWYDAKLAEPKKPWNKIPKDYQIGNELCPSFINKFYMYVSN